MLATFLRVHSNSKRYPTSLNKTSTLTWKLLVLWSQEWCMTWKTCVQTDFCLTKIVSSKPEVLEQIPEKDRRSGQKSVDLNKLSVNRKFISDQLEYRKKIKRKEGKECWQWSGGYTIFAERQKDSSGTMQKWLRVGGYGIRNTSWWLRTMAERAAVVRKVGNDEVLQASKFWQHNLLQSPPLLSCKTRCIWSSIVSETGG